MHVSSLGVSFLVLPIAGSAQSLNLLLQGQYKMQQLFKTCFTDVNYSQQLLPQIFYDFERSCKFCVKNMQFFPNATSTDIAFSASDIVPIETFIKHTKLQFLGKLRRLSDVYLAKIAYKSP